jgi:hypothetical protein
LNDSDEILSRWVPQQVLCKLKAEQPRAKLFPGSAMRLGKRTQDLPGYSKLWRAIARLQKRGKNRKPKSREIHLVLIKSPFPRFTVRKSTIVWCPGWQMKRQRP